MSLVGRNHETNTLITENNTQKEHKNKTIAEDIIYDVFSQVRDGQLMGDPTCKYIWRTALERNIPKGLRLEDREL